MVNYPVKKSPNFTVVHKNRGIAFEKDINITNEYYLNNDIAVIHKKPVPIQVVSVNYPSRDTASIDKAFYTIPSTTDYNGIYKGNYIDFEAKETKNKTSFSFVNIHEHQIKHLIKVEEHGGISFILVKFTLLDEIFLLETKFLKNFFLRKSNGGRKSITIEEFRTYGHLIATKYSPRVDYLKVLDEII